MPLRRLLMLPHLVRWGIRAPRDAEGRWDRYWAGVGSTGDGGDVLWDSSDPDEPARYLDILERFADPDLPVLDLGCGNGRFTRALSLRGWRAIGVDVSDAAVALAHDESGSGSAGGGTPPSFVVADLTDAGAMDRLAEELGEVNVLVRGVLHVLDPDARRELARNVGRLLGDRGVAVIAETNHQGSLLSYLESLGAGARGCRARWPGPSPRACPRPARSARRSWTGAFPTTGGSGCRSTTTR
ncbi:class I SAM-dependent methyltransferase [Actinomycetospora sp. OC33-EN08]|uniref:Class I SAM-dependent methyltransferase n=1 Tax=Actinomycetospora aurantiaca TaxID=3129233 RepID=A0ABU8MKG9_9PSEU